MVDPSKIQLDLSGIDARRKKSALLRGLRPQIERLQGEGYTQEAIAAALTAQGIKVTRSSLATYLARFRQQEMAKGPQNPSPAVTSSAPALSSSPSVPTEGPDGEAEETRPNLTKREKREALADRFVKPQITNPLLKDLKK